MNFEDSLQYLSCMGDEVTMMKPGLERARIVLTALNNPQNEYRCVHVAGTNGKGSTCAMVAEILKHSGRRVGLYTSPHIDSITERIVVDGNQIGEEEFSQGLSEIKSICDELIQKNLLEHELTFFEKITVLAFWHFRKQGVDIAVLEVGLGGRMDTTNVCVPSVCAITTIGLDHQNFLGNSLEEIAREKAGIAKQGVPLIVAPQIHGEVMASIISEASDRGAEVTVLMQEHVSNEQSADGAYSFTYTTPIRAYGVNLSLRGRHQIINACTAISVCEELEKQGIRLSESAYLTGLASVTWRGRLEKSLYEGVRVLLDGAHNADGAQALADYLMEHEKDTNIVFVFGVLADKNISQMLESLRIVSHTIVVTTVKNPRAATLEYEQEVAEKFFTHVVATMSPRDAVAAAREIIGESGLICVWGSLYLLHEVREVLS